jgi:hypothetical protein
MTSRRRLAVGAGLVLALAACGSSKQTGGATQAGGLPTVERQRIVAEFGRTYLPASMPAGYIYIRWLTQPGSADAFGDSLEIDYGNHGRPIQWSVENAQDPNAQSHYQCATAKPYGKRYQADGKTAYYVGGAVGQSATICMPDHRGVTAWNAYSISRAMLVKLAASAYAVG